MNKKLFESGQAAKIIGTPERALRYWATIRAISPIQDTPGTPGIRRLYSFENLVEGAILRELKKQGITISLGERAVTKVREKDFGAYKDLVWALLLIIGGNKIEVITTESFKKDKLMIEFMDWNPGIDQSQISDDLWETIRTLIEQGNTKQTVLKGLHLRLRYAQLGELIENLKESVLIIPIHTLWNEIRGKIKK